MFNGEGAAWQAAIVAVTKKAVVVQLESPVLSQTDSPLPVHLGQSLSRGERMDYAIQKATEAGVTAITPLFSERCEVKLNAERQEKRLKHWQQVAISACEQCGRNILPVIYPAMSVDQWIAGQSSELKLVLHHRTEQKLQGYQAPSSVSLLVGPEGGLTADEIALAEGQGFNALALGPRVFRTETAPVVALSLLQYFWGDLG